MRFHISEELKIMIEDALEYVPFERIEHKCPRCGGIMAYPIVCREHDLEIMQKMLDSTRYVMKKYGITEKIIDELREEIRKNLSE